MNELAAAAPEIREDESGPLRARIEAQRDTDHLHPAVMAKEVHDFPLQGRHRSEADRHRLGGWTTGIFGGRWMRANRPGQGIVCGYQYGAIGPDLAMMIGAGAAVQRGVGPQAPYKGAPACASRATPESPTACSSSIRPRSTRSRSSPWSTTTTWGMWSAAIGSPRSMHMYLFQENSALRQDGRGWARAASIADARGVPRGAGTQLPHRRAGKPSTLINVQALKEFTSARLYPPGPRLNAEPSIGGVAH